MDPGTEYVFYILGFAALAIPAAIGYYLARKHFINLKIVTRGAVYYLLAGFVAILSAVAYIRLTTPYFPQATILLGAGFTAGAVEEALRYVLTGKAAVKSRWEALGFGLGWALLPFAFAGFGVLTAPLAAQSYEAANMHVENAGSGGPVIESRTLSPVDAFVVFIETASTFTFQIALAVAVSASVTRKNTKILAACALSHGLVNALTNYLMAGGGYHSTPVYALAGFCGAYFIWKFKP